MAGKLRFDEPVDRTAGGLRAFLVHELYGYRRYWKGTVVVSTVTPLLYLLSLGLGLGSLVDSRGGAAQLGTSYLSYIAPALLAATGMQIAATESTFPVMAGFQWEKAYFAMHATPLTPRQILRGSMTWVAIRVATAAVVFYLVVAAFGAARTWQSVLSIPLATLGSVAFAAPIFLVAAAAQKDGVFNYIFRFVVTPMMLFAGTFYDISALPRIGQVIAWVTPLWHTNELVRAVSLGPLDLPTGIGRLSPAMWALHLGYLAVWLVVGYLLAARMFRKRLVT
ncbi:ABC transporter permease [Cumulibacter manganitolerans]|uniref:ABC transporter permease n=1 Tax=Cumulibacter manganitolerans TaxID=1884992 RepID=UPI001294DCF1|nr:ABC transporter permease [Cumulibacter manganitolerans]